MSIPIPRFRSLALIALGVATCALSIQIHADTKYRIFDLGALSTGLAAKSQAFGVSNPDASGYVLVVGDSTVSGSPRHGWVWATGPIFGLTPFTVTDLNGITVPSALNGESRALKVNQYGHAVGFFNSAGDSVASRACSWTLDDGEATAVNLGTVSGGTDAKASEARDVSQANPAWVAAWGGYETGCTICPTCAAYVLGFRVRPDGTSKDELEPSDNEYAVVGETTLNIGSWGYAINASGVAAGRVRPCGEDGGECINGVDAATWSVPDGGGDEIEPLPTNEENLGQHEVLGINDSNNMVGVGWALPGDGFADCNIHASYWISADASPVNLGVLDGIGEFDGTKANAINNPDHNSAIRVVGQNTSLIQAALWTKIGSSWEYDQLDTLLLDEGKCDWERLAEATDINDVGMVSGWGDHSSAIGFQDRGFLLKPACLGDIDENCKVDGFDLGVLLGAWEGTCPAGQCFACYPATTDACRADLNCDGVVDGFDLGLLLGEWNSTGPCGDHCQVIESASSSSSSSSQQESSSSPALEELLSILNELGMEEEAALLESILGS